MATVQGAELFEVIIDGGESAKNLNRPGLQRLLTMVDSGRVEAVIVAKLDRLTRSVKDLCSLLELFEKRSVALVSVAESLDTASAAGRLVITIMAAVRPWRAGCAHGNPSPAPERPHDAGDRGRAELQGAADAPWCFERFAIEDFTLWVNSRTDRLSTSRIQPCVRRLNR